MTNGDQAKGGQGGGRTYSEEDVMTLMNEAARRAATEAVKKGQREDDEDDSAVSVINPKVVKQLKDTVAVFTALKDLSSNPLQKTIEETVGGMAASVVQNAFAPRGPPPKQDIVDKLLNSQFAYGLGSGLGQRGPELVETMGRTFGSEKAGQMIDNMMGKYGSGQGGQQGGQSRQLSPSNPSPSNPTPSPSSEQKADKQSEKELLLSLDPNNPEHVSAYAETQGGLPVEVARKMLMIHQDAFIEQLKREGMNVDQISTQRGSHSQPQQSSQPAVPLQQNPVQQNPVQQNPVQQNPVQQNPVQQNPVQQNPPQSRPETQYIENPDIQYAENHDVPQPGPSYTNNHAEVPPTNQNNQEMMQTFAGDIGKVMGEMLNRIETLNNSVFSLQSELNTMKKQGIQPIQPPIVSSEIPPVYDGIPSPGIQTHVPIISPTEIEMFEDPIIEEPATIINKPRTSREFFEEDIQDKSEFIKELEEETKSSQIQISPLSKPASSGRTVQVPPSLAQAVQVAPPPVQRPQTPTPLAITPNLPTSQSDKPTPLQEEEKTNLKDNIEDSKEEKTNLKDNIEDSKEEKLGVKEDIVDIPTESKSENINNENLHKNISDNKETDKFITPIKKVGIHKKADMIKNAKPSFKKIDEQKDSE